MIRIMLFFCLLTVFYTVSNSQSLIAVQSGGSSTFYTSLDSAMANAPNGATIYLPGGSFTPANGALLIDKTLNIIGTGHYPDSALATGISVINGHVYLLSGADGGSMQGVHINNHVFFGQNVTNCIINGYSFSRCYFGNPVMMVYDVYYLNPTSQNILFSENVFTNYVNIAQVKNVLFSKNIFLAYFQTSNGQVVFRNNIFLFESYGPCGSTALFHEIHGAAFYDNIINHTGCYGLLAGNFTGNTFYNNIFSTNLAAPPGNSPGYGNLYNVPIDSIYVSHTYNIFNYQNDYRLKPGCVGVNAASDTTDIGLYGTAFPYKPGAVPINPHIISRTVAPSTNAQGNLQVNIKVSAQER